MSESLIIVSSDTHVGPRLAEDLRPYCPAKYLDEFDAYTAANVEPVGSFGRAPGTGFAIAGVEPKKVVREFRLSADAPEGDLNLTVTQFQPGDFVDVIGRSKGKGFQGVMKKHNFAGQGAAHGSKTHRRNGAIGNRSTPGRIWKNMGMPGHMGDERVTVQNLQVMQVREAEKVILVSGAVPGSNGSYVVVRPAVKHPEKLRALHAEHRKHDEEEAAKKPAITVR